MTKILVVEDDAKEAANIQQMLEESAFQVEVAQEGLDALARMKSAIPDAVLTKLHLPDLNGLQLVETIRERHPTVPVVLMTSDDASDIAVKALQAGAASYIHRRSIESELISTMAGIARMLRSQRNQEVAISTISTSQTRYEFGNDHEVAAEVLAHLEKDLRDRNYFDPTEVFRIALALREAVVNAIDHGNLQLDSVLRDDSNRSYRQEGLKRATQEPYCSRHVTVTASLESTEVRYTIEDEGTGFDPATIDDPIDQEHLNRSHGRGLMLMRSFLDEVSYNERGNKLTLVKRCSPQE
jgi:DNA-binding response OmpR family regulator